MGIAIESPVLGALEIEQSDVYVFASGIPGFEDSKRYTLIQPEAGSPFAYFQSVDRHELVLLVVDPFLFFTDYDFELNEQTVTELGIESTEDVVARCVVSVPERIDEATVNLLAPIVLSRRARKGRQCILEGTSYKTKHTLFPRSTTSASSGTGGVDIAGSHP